MRKHSYVLTILAIVLAFGLAFVSCGGGDGNNNTPGGQTPGGNTPGTSPVTVSLDKTSLTLVVGLTNIIYASVNTSNASNMEVSWSSSNPGVASVSSTVAGVVSIATVMGLSAGTATITVTTLEGGYSATCSVTIFERTLDGTWQDDRYRNIITISGSDGIFVQFGSSWTEAVRDGILLVGDQRFRNIKSTADNNGLPAWTAEMLIAVSNDRENWNWYSCTIILSRDGQSFNAGGLSKYNRL